MTAPIKFTYLEFECEIHLEPLGYYCGYVGVNVGHPAHDLRSGALDKTLSVHGGVSYTNYLNKDSETWFFGFDCAHDGDGLNSSKPNWRDAKFVEAECMELATQLANVSAPIRYEGVPLSCMGENRLRAVLIKLLVEKEKSQ